MEIRKIIYRGPDYSQMIALRANVLYKPFSLELTQDRLDPDKEDYLLGYFESEKIIGCLVLQRCDGGWIRMRQVAVDATRQKSGIGRAMLKETYKISRRLGYSKLFCQARESAVPFYAKDGWKIIGDKFSIFDIPHYRMEIFLEP